MSAADTREIVGHIPPRRRRWSKENPPYMRIVLLGKSVSENSGVGNFLLGRAAFDSEAPPDVVERVGGRLKDRHVTVINSPQLLQTNISDHQITQTVRECVSLSDPGPHVIVLLLKHEQCSAEDQECVEKVLDSFSESVYQHTMVLSTRESTETNDILQKIIQKCFNRHFSLQRSSSPDDLLQAFEDIVKMNDGRHLVCAEDSQYFTMKQQATERLSEGVKLNLVLCGSDGTLTSSISDQILQQTDRRSDVELHGRQISLVELPALFNTRLSEEEVMRQTLRCVSLCDPGVHVFLLIIPDAPLNNEDKAEMEEIQRIFSSRINKHMMILIMQNSEHQTDNLNEETRSFIERFGGQHHFFGPNTQVSTLMENIEKMLEENRGEFFSTETFLEAQMKKLMKFEEMKKKIHSPEKCFQSQGSTESEDDLRIVLLGKTGVGKSATGNTILGRDVFTAETSQESVTKESQKESSEINGRHVTVIDTPGLFDTELSNEEIQREIRHCISMILPGPHVFIIVLNLGQRFTREEATAVKIIQETFGERSLMFTMVLFTRGDYLKNKNIEQCLGKPGSALMNLIEACENRYHVFNNNQTGDRTQVSDLLEKIDNMVTANGGSFYSCKMFRQMEREKQEQQMKILMDRVREKEGGMKKLEEEMKREQEKYKNKIKQLKKDKENLQIKHDKEIDSLINRIENERKRREEEYIEREERYKTLMKEKEDVQSKHEEEENKMKIVMEKQNREREEVMKKHGEEKERMKMMMEEEQQNQDKDKKKREEEFREREERYKREMKEHELTMQDEIKREREIFKDEIKEIRKEKENVKKEKDNLQIKYQTEIDRLMNGIQNERQNHDKERERREEEFKEREERYKREMKDREEFEKKIREEMRQDRETFKHEIEEMKQEKGNLQITYQTEIDRLMNRIEIERQNHEKERKRREEECTEREERYNIQIRREREEWEQQKLEEKRRREEEKKMTKKEKQISDEQIQRLKIEMEGIIREKERIERERREQQEDLEKKLTEERNMREDQQKTSEETLKLLEEHHKEELKRRRVEWREEYEQEKERIERERLEQLEDLEKKLTEERNMREDQQKTSEETLKLLEEHHEEELKRRCVEWREEYEREKERIERERLEQLEDLEKKLTEERNMREDQQKTSEETLKLLEEHHKEELKRRRVEWREEYEQEKERIERERLEQLEDLEKKLTEERNMREDQQKTSEETLKLLEEHHEEELKRRHVEWREEYEQEKERIERERLEQLEDLEKKLTEERNMREDQQKTSEETLKLLEEHHKEELKRRRVEWREEYEQEKERIERERLEQLEDLEKKLTEERNMREDQQKTSEETLKLLEEHHEEELKRRRVEWREEYEREKEKMMKICSETDQGENKDFVTAEVRVRTQPLFHRLRIEVRHLNKLRTADVLQITAHSLQSHDSCAEEELIQSFIQKLLMMNYRARYIKVRDTNEQHHIHQIDYKPSEDEFRIFDEMSLSNEGASQSDRIHPMDVQVAVFHCSDGFLKQLMVTKLSQCQYALPLLVPDPFTQQIEFPLWTFRQINKSWKMRNTNNETISKTHPVYKAETPMVSFFRFGSVSSSKSQLMNSLINEKHNTFFHRNCPGSSRTRELMDGVVEIAWFCPSGKNTDKFNDCVAFCNLHGDAGANEKQLQILTEMSSVNVVLLPRLDRNDSISAKIQNLYMTRKPLICLITEDKYTISEMKKGKFKIGLKDRNQSDVSEELRRAINVCLSESSSTFRLENVSKYSDIRVDEEDDEDCKRGREAAEQMMSLLEKKHLTEIKESFLPHQGKLWHQWSQKNKELHRPQGDTTGMDISRKHIEIREWQHQSDICEFIRFFIKKMNSHDGHKMFFLKWLRILLDEYTSADLSALLHKYDEKWSTILQLKEKHNKSEQLKVEQIELERISEDLQAATFGLEHIMREIAQIYESCSSLKKNKKDLQVHFSSLPSLAAEMMISGFPLELMDGDAAHVPVIWISAVLDQLIQKLGDQRVFVLSVLGLQSSGKSTMLNAMFGLQFAVSPGMCTRGAFMQLVRVSDEMKTQMNFDYILVVDTEGLRALELAGRSTKDHDNELATFVVGLANLTLINIFGEYLSEMQDILPIIVQAFLRMKKVRLNPSCVFVHQNVSDVTAGEKNMEGRRRLQEKLDEMTKLAAEEEICDVVHFHDVIKFDVQNDVKYFAQLWEGNPPMAPPNPKYCENIQELKKTIVAHASKSHGIMLTELKDHIKDLWEALLNERFVFSFENSLLTTAKRKLETKYSKWSLRLRSAMMEIENKLLNKIDNEEIHEVEETDLQKELKTTSEEVEKSMSEFFEKDTYAEILSFCRRASEIKIKEFQENIVRETKRKLNEILQQRDLKKKTDERKHHENTLYEKSKELALKLKDKTNDEETLKKEFDLFWENNIKKIIGDIDILKDVRETFSSYKLDKYKNVFTAQSYTKYAIFRKSSIYCNKQYTNVSTLVPEDEAQIRSFITDVAIQTDKMIQSFNISKMGYKISCLQQLTEYIKRRVTEHKKKCKKYTFNDDFFMDLVYSICERANKMITDQHRQYREAKNPDLYTEKKREEYYSVFQKYCHEATSAAIFGEIICQKLKEPIEQSVYKKTARDLTDEIMKNCESLNGNRSKLEKHILKTLAEEEDFDKYMNYIHNPRDHFKSFVRDEVSRYITDKFSVSVLPKMKRNIKLLQEKIVKAAHESTEHVQENRGDVGLWLKSFTQVSDVLIFSEKDLSGVKHDVDDFNLLEDVIRQELSAIMSDIWSRFNTETFPVNLDYKFRLDELLIDHFCQCCWVQCPFCKAVCTNTIENHPGDHSVPFHRVTGINGFHFTHTNYLCADICTDVVASDGHFYTSNGEFLFRDYRRAGGDYADWSIIPDHSDLAYWKWFVCRFQKDLEKYYMKTFSKQGEIPYEWKRYEKQDAIDSLYKHYQ